VKVELTDQHYEALAKDAKMMATTPAAVLAAILEDFLSGWGRPENRRLFYIQVAPQTKQP